MMGGGGVGGLVSWEVRWGRERERESGGWIDGHVWCC